MHARTEPGTRATRRTLLTIAFALAVLALDTALIAFALGGVDALLAHRPALALLAVYAVTGIPLALLRPSHGQDIIARVADPAWQMASLLVIPLAIPALSALGQHRGLGQLPAPAFAAWLGVTLVAAGLWLRIVAMMTLGPRFAPVVALQREHALETRGVYARVRHPGYLGAWVASLGAMLVFRNALATPLLVLFAWLLAERARREEAVLEGHFGDAYRAWVAVTGAFLPRRGRRR